MLAAVAVVYWGVEKLGVRTRQRLVRWIARLELEVVYVKVLALGREATVLETLQLAKLPSHLCLSLQPVPST